MNSWKNKVDSPVISGYTYNVNNLGQRTAVATAGEVFDTASPADWRWSYDVLGQVKSANRDTAVAGNTAENYQYAYDQIGNRVTTRKGTAPDTIYTANALNQYATIGTRVTPTYDADGNQLNGLMPTAELSERGQLIFSYNAENRPLSVSKNGVLQEAYSHDHMGRRIQEGNTITIYDGYNAIAEYSINGVLKTTYAWGLDLSNTLQGAGGVGGLLSVTDYTTQTPLVSYPTYDGNGNVTEYVTEANNGTLATHYEYDSFGNVIRNTMNKNYRYQFSTKPYNRLTGLSYYNYRDYDPVSGRWISPDPIEEQGGLNLYAVLKNNVINLADYLGNKDAECRCPEHAGQMKEVSVTLITVIGGSEGKFSDPKSMVKNKMKEWAENPPTGIGKDMSDFLTSVTSAINTNSAMGTLTRIRVLATAQCCKLDYSQEKANWERIDGVGGASNLAISLLDNPSDAAYQIADAMRVAAEELAKQCKK